MTYMVRRTFFSRPNLLIFYLIMVAAIAFTTFGYQHGVLDHAYTAETLLVASCLFILATQVARGGLFSLFGLVTLSIIIYHSLIPLLNVTFIPFIFTGSAQYWAIRLPESAYVNSVLLTNLGLVCFAIGGVFGDRTRPNAQRAIVVPTPEAATAMFAVAMALLAISLYPFATELLGYAIRAYHYGYAARWMREDVNLLAEKVGYFAVVSAFLLLALGSTRYRSVALPLSVGIILSYFLTYLFVGERSTAFTSAVAYLWLWSRSISPVRLRVLVPTGLAFGWLFGVVQAARVSVGSLTEKVMTGLSAGLEDYVGAGVYIYVFASVIDLVPRWEPFGAGMSYLASLLLLAPNVGSGTHAAVEHLPRGFIKEAYFARTSDTFDVGFSIFAEPYYNFGWLGIPVVLLSLGFLIGRLSEVGERTQNPLFVTFIGLSMIQLLFLGRSYFGYMPRFFLWYGLLPMALTVLLMMLNRKLRFSSK